MEKNYLTIHIVFIAMALYLINLPFFSNLITSYTPIKTICVYKKLTNKNCPYCGITTQISDFKNNKEVPSNENSLKENSLKEIIIDNRGRILYYFAWTEISIRILLILFKKYKSKKIFYADMLIHGILLSCFFMINMYFISFLM